MTIDEIFNKFQINDVVRTEIKKLDEFILLKIVGKLGYKENKGLSCIFKGSLKVALKNNWEVEVI